MESTISLHTAADGHDTTHHTQPAQDTTMRTAKSYARLRTAHLATARRLPQKYELRTALSQNHAALDPEVNIEESDSEVILSQIPHSAAHSTASATISRTDLNGPYVTQLFTNMPHQYRLVRAPSEYMLPQLEMPYSETMRAHGHIPADFHYGEAAAAHALAEKEWNLRAHRLQTGQPIDGSSELHPVISAYQFDELRDAVSALELDYNVHPANAAFQRQLDRIDEIIRRRNEYNNIEQRSHAPLHHPITSHPRLVTAQAPPTAGQPQHSVTLHAPSDIYLYAPQQVASNAHIYQVQAQGQGLQQDEVHHPQQQHQAYHMVDASSIGLPQGAKATQHGSVYCAAPLKEISSTMGRRYYESPTERAMARRDAYNRANNVGVIDVDPYELRPSTSTYQIDVHQ